MKTFGRRLAVGATAALASMAYVAISAPAVSWADCDSHSWWDPVANMCRPLGVTPLDCQTTLGNTRGGIEANTRGQISSGSLIPGKRTRNMSLESSIYIPTAQWFCCGLRSNAASTHRSPN